MEELQNIDLHSTISTVEKQEHPHLPPKQQPTLKQKLLRRQHSSMSFFGPSKEKSSKSSAGGALPCSGENTPDNDSPQLCRRFSHPPVLEDVNTYENNNENARQILNEILVKGLPTNREEQTILRNVMAWRTQAVHALCRIKSPVLPVTSHYEFKAEQNEKILVSFGHWE